jgi:hypothetical protein
LSVRVPFCRAERPVLDAPAIQVDRKQSAVMLTQFPPAGEGAQHGLFPLKECHGADLKAPGEAA